MEKIKCKICNSGKVFIFGKKENFDLYKCKNCLAGFVLPLPMDVDEIYSKEYFNNQGDKKFGYTDYESDKEPMRDIFLKYLKEISNKVDEKSVFDIGAATGFFLDLAKQEGWETSGSEISQYAIDEIKKRGHKGVSSNEINKVKEKYSLVTIWDVIEHVLEPEKLILEGKSLMNKNGYLLINTVDITSLWARILGKNWNAIVPPEHLYFFSEKSLRILLERNGFKVESVKKLGKKFSLPYIFKTLYYWQNLKIWKWLSSSTNNSLFRKIQIPINLRDNIIIIAKNED